MCYLSLDLSFGLVLLLPVLLLWKSQVELGRITVWKILGHGHVLNPVGE